LSKRVNTAVPAWVEALRRDIVFCERLRGHDLCFHSTWGLFSPRAVDEGSRLLLEHIEIGGTDRCLDLGCGYGPVGVTLARCAPRGQVLMVDKDFVAVELAARNIAANRLDNAEALLSNGFDQVARRRFDLIASNIPAKVGRELLSILLYDTRAHLSPGGRLYVVTVSGLRRFIERNFIEVFGNYDKLKQGAHYTVAMATLPD